jgi:hypothetical protein
MRAFLARHKEHWSKAEVARTTLFALGLFLVSVFVVQPWAVNFATIHASNPVEDIILSHIPVFNVGIFFVYGMFTLIGFVVLLCFHTPKYAPFALFSLSLFVLIRSAFVCMTHIGPFATQAASTFGPKITEAFFGADLFFSGHTGAPFLLALLFWQKKGLRNLFLIWSAFFAAVVLMGHLHYTIDVASAYFITFGIFCLARWLFPNSYELFHKKAL